MTLNVLLTGWAGSISTVLVLTADTDPAFPISEGLGAPKVLKTEECWPARKSFSHYGSARWPRADFARISPRTRKPRGQDP